MNIFSSKRKEKKSARGFSLLEVLTAMFIFSLVMTSVVMYFTKIVLVQRNAAELQRNLEDTQVAFGLIAKTLRTSVVIVGSGQTPTLRVYDYSQAKCIQYEFSANSLFQSSQEITTTDGSEKTECQTHFVPTETGNLIASGTASLDGKFFVVPSGTSTAGRITMNVEISRGGQTSVLQTSASLRNYKEHL